MSASVTVPASQFVRFLFAGGIAAAANFGSRFLFSRWMSYEQAVVLAFLVGITVAFILMRGHVFDAKGKPPGPQVAKFVGINILALLQTLIISVVLNRWLLSSGDKANYAEAVAHLVGVAVPMVTSYLGHKFLTFR